MSDEKRQPEGEPETISGEAEPATPGGSVEGARVAELSAELATLRAESSTQLEALRTENGLQMEAYCSLARSLPGVVPELVAGTTLEAVQTSLVTAREAYSRVAASLAVAPVNGSETSFGPGPGPGAGGGARSGLTSSEDQPARLSSERGVNLIYQAITGGKSGNLAR